MRKILSRATMETGPDRRHSSIISALHTPSACVHIPSPFLIPSHVSDLSVVPARENTGGPLSSSSGLRLPQRCLVLQHISKNSMIVEKGRFEDRNRKEWGRWVFRGRSLQGCRSLHKEDINKSSCTPSEY